MTTRAVNVAPRCTRRTPVAYRVTLGNGSLVLCDQHLELLRITRPQEYVRLTGETFAVKLCDHCHPENS